MLRRTSSNLTAPCPLQTTPLPSSTPDEAQSIRDSGDKLKCYAEGFVRCCEEGDFESIEKAEKPRISKSSTELPCPANGSLVRSSGVTLLPLLPDVW